MTQLILDAAFPGADVTRWIATLHMAGAAGCMAYVYDQQIPMNWPPAYCHAIQAAGFGILPVYVWGPAYPAIGHARQVMASYGWSSGPVMGDIEAGSTPSTAYFAAWCNDLRAGGYTPVVYGTPSTIDTYGRYADKRFAAIYVQRQLNPIYNLAGVSYDGVQYANSFQINGVEVDASVTSVPLIGGGNAPPGGTDPLPIPHTMKRSLAKLAGAALRHEWANEAEVEAWAGFINDDGSGLEELLDRMEKDQGPGITYDQPPPATPGPVGPAGPVGPPGPVGPAGSIPATVSITGGTLNLK